MVKKYPQVKVWNLSLSRKDMVCCDDAFSEFGMELDRIQQKYDVAFVSCAGNFEELPLRGWPPEDLGERDRIHPPADSALGVSVGAVAHVDRPNSRVRLRDPSPFSRRGPGAAFLPKPEVGHIGGNCDGQLNYRQVGVLSLSTNGQVCEAIGTSFSTPIVSSILASIRSGTAATMSRTLAKALLVHSAALRHGPIDAAELRYRGFGVPGDLSEVLTCPPWQATLIFEPELQPAKKIYARADFPIPKCFRRPDGRVEGEFLMTLVYDPPLSPNAGAEYCQTNVDVSLGTYDVGKNGKAAHESKIPLEPRDYSKLYEQHLVEHGFKWSPVKVYRKALEATGGQRWRLMLNLLYRATVQPAADPWAQGAARSAGQSAVQAGRAQAGRLRVQDGPRRQRGSRGAATSALRPAREGVPAARALRPPHPRGSQCASNTHRGGHRQVEGPALRVARLPGAHVVQVPRKERQAGKGVDLRGHVP